MSIARFIGGTLLGCALLAACPAHAADDAISDEARRHFNAGVTLLQDPDGARYEDAFAEFQAAYAASLSPKILGNIGYCALKLERDGDAISAYTRYLQEVPDVDPVEAAQINRDLATLRAGLVRVTVIVDVPGAAVVDKRVPVRGETITNLYGPVNGRIEIGLRPGHHAIEMRLRGEVIGRWDFDARPGSALSRTFFRQVVQEVPRRRAPSTLPWIVTTIGGASLAASGVVGAVLLSKVNSISNNCPGNQCPSAYALKPAQDDVHLLVPIADTLLFGGAAVTLSGIGLLLWSGGSLAEPPSRASRAAPAISSIFCTSSGCTAAISGSFLGG